MVEAAQNLTIEEARMVDLEFHLTGYNRDFLMDSIATSRQVTAGKAWEVRENLAPLYLKLCGNPPELVVIDSEIKEAEARNQMLELEVQLGDWLEDLHYMETGECDSDQREFIPVIIDRADGVRMKLAGLYTQLVQK